jgi:putative acetyltransferase
MDVDADGRSVNALGLAPLAVLPDSTGRGIGSALIEAGIAEAARIGAELIFVLGDTDFYGRFGFKPEAALPFVSPYAGAHFQALLLNQSLDSVVTGSARYTRAFAEL